MTNLKASADKGDADDQPGACWIVDQQTGQQMCHYITKSECDQRQGVFYGGPCPPLDMVAEEKPKPTTGKAQKPKKAKRKARPKTKKRK
jgi:hypothetical protein